MKQLADTLPATKLPEDSPKELSPGLTVNAGTSIIEPRPNPLTESQLTQIASKLLLKPPSVFWTKKKIYDAAGCSDNPIGEEDAVDVSIFYRGEMTRQLLEAALRPSPPAACVAHLTRLSIHKRLGSSDADRAMLLHDYADALRDYSDFVVYLACKSLWESNESPFYPKIKTLRDVCETFHVAFTGLIGRLSDQKAIAAAPPPKRVKEEDSDQGKIRRREMCEFLGKPEYFDQVRLWSNYDLERAVARWKADLQAHAEAGSVQTAIAATSTAKTE